MIRFHSLLPFAAISLLAGCVTTGPTMGDQSAKTVATGSAGGATATNENKQLEKCDTSLGTLAVVEDQSQPWFGQLTRDYRLTSTVPLIRLLVQQSNCFVIVERGRAFNQMQQERALRDTGEMRAGSRMGPGQIVAADYSMNPTISFSQKDAGGMGGALGGVSRGLGVLGAIAGSLRFSEASTMLTLIDNRSGVQLAAAEGSSKNTDFGLWGGLFGGSGGGALGGYTNTPEGKVLAAAFADSYSQLVKSVKAYRAQTVKGGLGTGGTLGVQGGNTAASQKVDAPTVQPTSTSTSTPAAGSTAPKATPKRTTRPAAKPATAAQ